MMAGKISLSFYEERKYKCGREDYIDFCSRNERSGIAWMKAGIWKLCTGLE
jgi:hypothetical protein